MALAIGPAIERVGAACRRSGPALWPRSGLLKISPDARRYAVAAERRARAVLDPGSALAYESFQCSWMISVTGKPLLGIVDRRAGRDPPRAACRTSCAACAQPSTQPGTVTDWMPSCGIVVALAL